MVFHLLLCQFPPLVPADTPSHPWLLWTVGRASGAYMDVKHPQSSSQPVSGGPQTHLQYLTQLDSLKPAVPWSLKGTPSSSLTGHRQVLTQRMCA
jgi:hypothetical protein